MINECLCQKSHIFFPHVVHFKWVGVVSNLKNFGKTLEKALVLVTVTQNNSEDTVVHNFDYFLV